MSRFSASLAALVPVIFALGIGVGVGAGSAQAGPPASRLVIHVEADAAPGGSGTAQRPFGSIPDAVAAARAVPGIEVIAVRPGEYGLDQTLVLDTPVELRGSTRLVTGSDGWPTGEVEPASETRIYATNASQGTPLILVGSTDGVIRGVQIQGFVLQATPTAIPILLNRVQGYRIAESVFRAPGSFGIQSVASSGSVTGNHFSGLQTGAIFTGGYAESPSSVVVSGNRAVGNLLGGVLLNGASINIPEHGDRIDAVIRDNDLSDHASGAQGFGLRIFILRRDLGAPGDTQSFGSIFADVRDNRIVGNRLGLLIDAGFPYRQVAGICDSRVYSGVVDLRLASNTVAGSLLRSALVTFTRSTAAASPGTLSQWQYLHSSRYIFSDPDGALDDAWIDHPTADPFVGVCPADSAHEQLGNELTIDGEVEPHGRNF